MGTRPRLKDDQQTYFVEQLVTEPADLELVEAYWYQYYTTNHSTSFAANRVMQLVLKQIVQDNYCIQSAYLLHAEDFTRHMDRRSPKEQAKEALYDLFHVILQEEWPAQANLHPTSIIRYNETAKLLSQGAYVEADLQSYVAQLFSESSTCTRPSRISQLSGDQSYFEAVGFTHPLVI